MMLRKGANVHIQITNQGCNRYISKYEGQNGNIKIRPLHTFQIWYRLKEKYVCVWSPNPSQDFLGKFLFILLLNPSPLGNMFLIWYRGLRLLRKSGSLFGKVRLVG